MDFLRTIFLRSVCVFGIFFSNFYIGILFITGVPTSFNATLLYKNKDFLELTIFIYLHRLFLIEEVILKINNLKVYI